jgi:hypothetical protein
MNQHPAPYHFRLIAAALLIGISLCACQFTLPKIPTIRIHLTDPTPTVNEAQPGAVVDGPEQADLEPTAVKNAAAPTDGGFALIDPTVGLEKLSGYRATLEQSVTGKLDGQPYQRRTKIDYTQYGGDRFERVQHSSATSQPDFFSRQILADGMAFQVDEAGETCSGWPAGEPSVGAGEDAEDRAGGIHPAALLPPLSAMQAAGSEVVDGTPAIRYNFGKEAFTDGADAPPVAGSVWLAEQGGYVLRFEMDVDAPAQAGSGGLSAGQSWRYSLSRLDGSVRLDLPPSCGADLLALPRPRSAEMVRMENGSLSYQSAEEPAALVDFYRQQLAGLGWDLLNPEPDGAPELPFVLTAEKNERWLSVQLDEGEAGLFEATLTLFDMPVLETEHPGTEDAGSTVEPARPGKKPGQTAPTPAAGQNDLPADVPLYPGALEVIEMPGSGVMFTAPARSDVVIAFYEKEMVANGWKVALEMKNPAGSVIHWEKGSRLVMIMLTPEGEKTTIMIIAD